MEKGKQKKKAIGRPSKRFSNTASEIKRAAESATPSANGTTTKVKTAGGTEAETTDVWSVRMLVAAVGWSTISTTKGLVAFFLENPDKVKDTFQLALNKYGNVTDVTIGSLIIDLDCGSQENFSKFQQDFKDGKVQEALENELRKIGCDAKLEVTLMKETPNVARTEMSKETVNFNPEVVSHGEGEAEKERDQEAEDTENPEGTDNLNKEDTEVYFRLRDGIFRYKHSKRFSNMAGEIKRAARSAIPSDRGTTTKVKTAGGTAAETTDVFSVRMLVAAVGWSLINVTTGLVAFFMENPDKVMDTFQLALNIHGNVTGVTIGSLIIHLDCGSQENFSKFQQDLKDGKVKEALENELSKIGCDTKLEVTLMKEPPNVAGTEMSKETVNFNPEIVSHGEGEAEKERDQEADNSDVEDGSPPKRRRPLSSSGSDPNINKATAEASELSAKEPAVVGMILAGSSGIEQPEDIITMDNRGNLNMREPPELRETLKVLEMKDLPPKTTPWKDIEEKFLPVDFLLLTAKECEHLSCLSFLDDIKMGDDDKLGPVYFGFNSSKSKIAVIKCAVGAAGPGGSIVVVQDAVPILRPKAVICVGYCASLDEKNAKLGDVIVPAKLITYALTKVRKNKIEHRGYVVPPNTKMAKRIKVAGASWVAPLKNPEDLKVTVRSDGVLLSGPTVLDNSELRRDLKNQFLQGTAIEMEGEGLYASAHNHGIEWLVIKGVSDFGDDNKSATDSWRPFASVMAASFVAHMLNDSIAFENWRHYGDPERIRASAGESYAEAAQPGPSNQGEPRSIQPGDKAQTTYKGVSDFGDDNKSATDSWRPFASVMAASFVAHMLNASIAFGNWRHYGDPNRIRASTGESYTEVAQPGPSNQRRSIRPGDKASFKAGVPSEGELEHLSLELGDQWEQLGGRLGFNQAAITCFDRDHKGLNRKAFKMLIAWREKEGADATYKVLYDALCDKRVQCKRLAQQFCCE